MIIIWDEQKRQTNLSKHGLNFAELSLQFFLAARISAAKQGRFVAVGEHDGRIVVAVVFKLLGSEALSVISMRPANKRERRES